MRYKLHFSSSLWRKPTYKLPRLMAQIMLVGASLYLVVPVYAEGSSTNIVFKDEINKLAPYALHAAKPWTQDEQAYALGLLRTIDRMAPGLLRRATAYRPLVLYRYDGDSNSPATMTAIATHNGIYFGDEVFNQSMDAFMLAHELVHLIDCSSEIEASPEWSSLVRPLIERVDEMLHNDGLRYTVIGLTATESLRLQTKYRDRIQQIGMPSLYSCLNGGEALAEHTAFALRGFKASDEIRKFIDKHFISESFKKEEKKELFHKALDHFASGHNEEALAVYQDILEKYPDFKHVCMYRAFIYRQQNNHDLEFTDLTTALDVLDSAPRLEAATRLRRAAVFGRKGKNADALQDVNGAVNLMPDNPQSYYVRSLLFDLVNDKPAVIKDLTTAIKLNSKYYDAYVKRADAWRLKKEYDNAINDYTHAIELSPSAHLYSMRGFVRYLSGDYGQAIEDFNEAIRLDPKNSYSYRTRGFSHKALGELDKAIADFTAGIGLNAKSTSLHISRGNIWKQKQDYEKAIQDYSRAMEIDPAYANAHNKHAWIKATCPDAEYRDGASAVQSATRACELTNWETDKYIQTLAIAYAENGDFEAAVKWLKKATEMNPGNNVDMRAELLVLFNSGKPFRENPAE